MHLELTDPELRVIGCLLEKAVVTPDQYPLTLNALTNACNQKTSRDPVMSMTQGEVGNAALRLEERYLVTRDEGFKSNVVKVKHRFCNTPMSELQFDPAEYALVTLLILRGPQTPGELRARSGRLHTFADNAEVSDVLEQLLDADREGGAVVARLPRRAGRQDHEYMHLFAGEIESAPPEDTVVRTQRSDRVGELEQRVAHLEYQLRTLAERLGESLPSPAQNDLDPGAANTESSASDTAGAPLPRDIT